MTHLSFHKHYNEEMVMKIIGNSCIFPTNTFQDNPPKILSFFSIFIVPRSALTLLVCRKDEIQN